METVLDAAKDRIDVEEGACDRAILPLKGTRDETSHEHSTSKQLLAMVGE